MRALVLAGLVVATLLVPSRAHAEIPPGAVFAEKPLPDGAVSVYGTLGFPGVQIGWRQGISGAELGAVAGFDYSLTQLTLDVPFYVPVKQSKKFLVGVGVSAGGFVDFGAKYFESTNLPSAGLRLAANGEVTLRINESVDVFVAGSLPIELPLTERGNDLYALLVGGGVELGVGDGFSVGAQLLAGPELLHPRGGQTAARFDGSLLVGLGKRFF
ncbi:MAG: hypothetical protein JST54_07915 [Deltaproteobacteria bacterium]|nr:hypothetical protein [Deltaproteobacteria bacterium]